MQTLCVSLGSGMEVSKRGGKRDRYDKRIDNYNYKKIQRISKVYFGHTKMLLIGKIFKCLRRVILEKLSEKEHCIILIARQNDEVIGGLTA